MRLFALQGYRNTGWEREGGEADGHVEVGEDVQGADEVGWRLESYHDRQRLPDPGGAVQTQRV